MSVESVFFFHPFSISLSFFHFFFGVFLLCSFSFTVLSLPYSDFLRYFFVSSFFLILSFRCFHCFPFLT